MKPSILLFLSAFAVFDVLADLSVYISDSEYEDGAYGAYPVQTYKSTNIVSPHVDVQYFDQTQHVGLHHVDSSW